jgi:four helix bundle protein
MDKYRSLFAWQQAHQAAVLTLTKCDSCYHPRSRALFDQLRRATISVEANIVEGYALSTPLQFRRHLRIAMGSAAEAECLTSVLWRQGANLSYYVSAAGGYAPQALKSQVSVRFANGEVRTRRGGLFGSDPTPGPGSEVFVPAEDPNAKKTDYVSLFGAIAQILASTIAIIVVLRR